MLIQVETTQQRSLKRTIGAIEAEVGKGQREELIASWVRSIDLADILSTIVDLVGLGKRINQHELATDISLRLIRRWAQSDVSTVSKWVQQLPQGQLRRDALLAVAVAWANSSLSEAMDWARQLPEMAEQQAVLFLIANEAVPHDPVVALRLATELPVDERWMDLVRRSAWKWAANDGEQALNWARQIQDEPFRNQVLASMTVAISEHDPASAANLALTEIPFGQA